MQGRKKIWLIILSACFVLGVALSVWTAFSDNAYAATARRYIKQAVAVFTVHTRAQETRGLPDDAEILNYIDGVLSQNISLRSWKDSKRVYRADNITRLVNYSSGYQIDLPADTYFDFSLAPLYVTAECDMFTAVVSRETSPYIALDATLTAELSVLQPDKSFADGTEQYIAYYQNRFLLSPGWQTANRVAVTEAALESPCGSCQWITAQIADAGDMTYDTRSYLYIRGEGNVYYRILFRYNSENEQRMQQVVQTAAASFYEFSPYGTPKYTTTYTAAISDSWNTETLETFEKIQNADDVRWGIFVPQVRTEGIDKTIPEIEEKIDHKFSVTLVYQHMNEETDEAFLEKNHQNGKLTEYTYQITTSNNLDLYGQSPLLDCARGKHDEEIRALARALRDFGHPILFRLCNEMNSDWTSYGGIINLQDPDIFRDVWKRFYQIFEEEGADNVIWIFNPNDNNYPPSNWNNFLAYYPGNGYVHMIGVTGYNTGTYYKDTWAEEWREFQAIYDAVEASYSRFFADFPWMITEFASSSVGGDKAKWVENMFSHMDDYENIKIAVWFSCPDYDPREGHEGQVSRPYWLDETEEVIQAFKVGLKDAPTGW